MVVLEQELTSTGASGPIYRSFSPTEERILISALTLIGRRGVRRLGMREIAETAEVSRGTLYRYFPSKEHVLAAAAGFDGLRFTDGLEAVLAVERAPERRISAFMSYAFEFIRTHPCRPLFESEPGFVMSYLLDNLPALRDELVRHLGDAFDAVPAVAAGELSKDELADVIARLFASSWIIPETDDASLVQAVNRILQISSEETHEQ
jgi:AcrR family transcriptional regulator